MMAGTAPSLSDRTLTDWLQLIRTDGVGPRTFLSLVNHFGGAAEALAGLPDLARRRGKAAPAIPSRQKIEDEIAAVRHFGAFFIAKGTQAYPKALAATASAPPLLTAIGPTSLVSHPLVSIVGSRNASPGGLRMAETLARELTASGFGIVSGLARGIDTKAHLGSLGGQAIAVVAGGIDKLYPEENRALFEKLCTQGLVVSEMPFGWVARGQDFPRRNRIVAGLSLGTIVVEAARKSGSLITARFASEEGREVFAVPGSPLDRRAEGPNDLIRSGATLLRTAEDVVSTLEPQLGRDFESLRIEAQDSQRDAEAPLWNEEDWLDLGIEAPSGPTTPPFDGWEEVKQTLPQDDDADRRILALLGATPVDVDDLARAAGLTARQTQITLFELEAKGKALRTTSGGIVAAFER
jgi:DNA processing protein